MLTLLTMEKVSDYVKALFTTPVAEDFATMASGDLDLLQRRLWPSRPDSEPKEEKDEKESWSNDSGSLTTLTEQPKFLGTSYRFHRCTGHARESFHAREAQYDALTKKYLETVLFKSHPESYDARIFDDSLSTTTKISGGGCYWEVFVPGVINDGTFIPSDQSSLNLEKQNAITQVTSKVPKHKSKVSTGGTHGNAIRILSIDPTNIAKYGFIFATEDLSGLRARLNSSPDGNDKPSYLIAIDAAAPSNQYYLNWDTLQVIAPLNVKDALYYDPDLMGHNYLCGGWATIRYEPADQDWFG
ncbi:hypothetical protein F5Y16DRAFT_357024 [Xylariaceae sp. FL0255]|nr:hypothetical protein F5Y16DRAFT_357024 [Xylariaceae sp. FL0255]